MTQVKCIRIHLVLVQGTMVCKVVAQYPSPPYSQLKEQVVQSEVAHQKPKMPNLNWTRWRRNHIPIDIGINKWVQIYIRTSQLSCKNPSS